MSTTSNPLETVKQVVADAVAPLTKSSEQAEEPTSNASEEHVVSPQSQEAKDKLERYLKERPDKSELVDKHILRGTSH
jgi:hypothetical protein